MNAPLWFGPYGSGALEHAAQLVSYGVNALWFHGFNGAAFGACAQHGLAACVEFKCFRADFARYPELVPIGVDGQPIRYGRLVQGICLSQQAFMDETEGALRAGVSDYQPAGIWLDYLTYGGWFETPEPDLQESCFCPACVAEFNEATGLDVTAPAVILGQHAAAWTAHKCERVAGYAARYAQIIREALPGCVIGAYMCPWTPDEYEGALSRIFAQDYRLLAPSIDVFTPLIYAHKSGRPPEWGRQFLERAPAFVPADRHVQLILDVLDYPESLQATASSARPSWGIQLFGGALVFAEAARARLFAAAVEEIRRRTNDEGRTPPHTACPDA